MKSFFVFAFGFGAGWAVRSLADSPHGVGVKLAEVAHRAKGHVNKWAATERERIVDIIAEGRFRAEQKNVFGKAKASSEQDQKIA
jgi:hypothetical protein